MSKIVTITGGAGYIGSHLVRQLLAKDYEVRVVDSGLFGLDSLPGDPKLTLYPGTVLNLTTLNHAFTGADAVVHLAGLVGDPACNIDARTTNLANIGGTRFVMTMAQYCKTPRLIFASSCSVYGNLADVGREDGPVNPVSLYARTKLQSELELLSDPDLPVTILRFSTVYGMSARMRFDLVANLFTAQAVTEGLLTVRGAESWRPFVHVADVASAIVATIEADDRVKRQIYNVGGDEMNKTIGDIARMVKSVTEPNYQDPVVIKVEDAPGDPRNYRVTFDKIRADLDWRPVVSPFKALSEMANYVFTQKIDYKQPRYHNHLVEQFMAQENGVPA